MTTYVFRQLLDMTGKTEIKFTTAKYVRWNSCTEHTQPRTMVTNDRGEVILSFDGNPRHFERMEYSNEIYFY